MKRASCVLLATATALLASAVVVVEGARPKCDESELRQFSAEYEVCHGRALQKLKSTAGASSSSSGGNGMQETLCSALDSLIEECTVILGWCYTSAEVEDTKRRQRALMAEAMEAAHFDSALCLGGGGETKISEPLTAASAAAPATSRFANIAAAVVATGVLMIFPR